MVFENIIHSHSSLVSVIEQDLGLLSITVSYFQSMQNQLRLLATVCSRLEHVATVFLQLAQRHVLNRASDKTTSQSTQSGSRLSQMPAQGLSADQILPRSDRRVDSELASKQLPASDSPVAIDMQGFEIDNLLDWVPADVNTLWPIFGTAHQGVATADATACATSTTARPKGSQGRKRPFDGTFDWFSWDAYYNRNDP